LWGRPRKGKSDVKVTAILCNHAEAINNLLYVSGGGITTSWVEPGSPSPYVTQLAIGLMVRVPWTATNQQHKVEVDLVDADDHPVQLPVGPNGETRPLHFETNFNIGRPPVLAPGDDQIFALALGMPGLAVSQLGHYRFLVKVDGSVEDDLSWTVANLPIGNVGMGGASGLPRL
jgi:hypothetical protein